MLTLSDAAEFNVDLQLKRGAKSTFAAKPHAINCNSGADCTETVGLCHMSQRVDLAQAVEFPSEVRS
eukprot:2167672-Rhodomonas_salina.1